MALGLLSGAAFWLNGMLFVVSMIFFCVLLYLYSGRLRRVAVPSAMLVAASVALFVAGAFQQSDGLRIVALVLLIGGLVLLGPVRESLPFFATAAAVAIPQMIWFNGGLGTQNSLNFHDGYLVENFRFRTPGPTWTSPATGGSTSVSSARWSFWQPPSGAEPTASCWWPSWRFSLSAMSWY
ncbi:MAG: hypothetical protein ACRDUV_22505 [Pseudonocardiaceae bacterium]